MACHPVRRRSVRCVIAIVTAAISSVPIACGDDDGVERTEAPAADAAARPSAAATGSTPAPPIPAPPPRLTVLQTTQHGPVLADGRGHALYMLEDEAPGASTCANRCAIIWPPYIAAAGVTAVTDSGVPGPVTMIVRPEGAQQVGYAGRALYFYLGDSGPGETLGEHVEDSWGEWTLVRLAGGGAGDRRGRRGGDDD